MVALGAYLRKLFLVYCNGHKVGDQNFAELISQKLLVCSNFLDT